MAQLLCKKCGAPLRPGAKFCIKCGTKIILEGQDQPVSQVEQANGAIVNQIETQPVQEVKPAPQQPPQPKKVDLEYVNSRKRTAKAEYEVYKKFEEEQKAKEEKFEEEPPVEEQQ